MPEAIGAKYHNEFHNEFDICFIILGKNNKEYENNNYFCSPKSTFIMARHAKDPWAKKSKEGDKLLKGMVNAGVKVGKAATSGINTPKLSDADKQKIIENRSAESNLIYSVLFGIITLFALGFAIKLFVGGQTFGGILLIIIGLFTFIGVTTFYSEYKKKK